MDTVSMVAPTQNCEALPNATLLWKTMRAGNVAVVFRVTNCQNMKAIRRIIKAMRSTTIRGEFQRYSAAPHSRANKRQVIDGRNNAVPSGSRCFIVSPHVSNCGFFSSRFSKKHTARMVMPPSGRLM